MKILFLSLLLILSRADVEPDVELSRRGPVLDQCETPTCWAHAWISYLNVFATQKFGHAQEFDVGYLLYHDLRSRGLAAYLAHEKELFVGGTSARAFALSRVHGLAPARTWVPKQSVVSVYKDVMAAMTLHLHALENQARSPATKNAFVRAMDEILLHHLGPPPDQTDAPWLEEFKLQHHDLRQATPAWVRTESKFENFVIDRQNQLRPIRMLVREEFSRVIHPESLLESRLRADVPMVLEFYTRTGTGDYTYVIHRLGPNSLPTYFKDMDQQNQYSSAHATLLHGLCGETLTVQDSRGTKAHHSGLRRLRPEFWRAHAYRVDELVPLPAGRAKFSARPSDVGRSRVNL